MSRTCRKVRSTWKNFSRLPRIRAKSRLSRETVSFWKEYSFLPEINPSKHQSPPPRVREKSDKLKTAPFKWITHLLTYFYSQTPKHLISGLLNILFHYYYYIKASFAFMKHQCVQYHLSQSAHYCK